MNREQQIIDALKKQRKELSYSSKLTSLIQLYDAVIDVHERNWLMDNGIIIKSKPVDFKPLIDAVAEENVRNNELELIEKSKCKDCSNIETDEQIRFIKMNKLGMLTLDD
jgi:hypothetical protein